MNPAARGYYYGDLLRTHADGTPIWGIRLPNGQWRMAMDMADFYVRRRDADDTVAWLNEVNGLTPPPAAQP
ncbi:hypothetical protein ACFYS8_13540 [Kitasatospora sp. NPDC004615]|uniref:hypothetical protein n=1 Tax=unclassified Kitasatospora TaxID=2633591 RepID=UPI0036A0C0B7